MKKRSSNLAVYTPSVSVPSGVSLSHPYAGQTFGSVMQETKKQRSKLRKVLRAIMISIILLFAGIGMLFTAVFIAMQFGLLNVRGSSKARNEFYGALPKTEVLAAEVTKEANPVSCVKEGDDGKAAPVCIWNKSEEWAVVRAGFVKDKDILLDVSKKTGVPARMITATIAPEQLRFFSSDREQFKRYFEPLKILGSMTQFSYGVAGVRLDTGALIEQYTVDKNSPFYAGKGMAKLVEYPKGANKEEERLKRLTDENHYYAYLYTALFIKEIQAQWASEGYDVSNRPDVIATLFNIGFRYSHPKPNPEMGGSDIPLNGDTFGFGELGTLYYRSEELTAIFPRYQ